MSSLSSVGYAGLQPAETPLRIVYSTLDLGLVRSMRQVNTNED